MVQVDAALRRAAYDVGYKQELIDVLEAEVIALRDGRVDDAEALRQARDGALGGSGTTIVTMSASNASEREADVSTVGPAMDDESDLDADRVAGTDRENDRVGAGEHDGDAPAEATAESGEDPVAKPDLDQRNGPASQTDHDETLGDRAATGR